MKKRPNELSFLNYECDGQISLCDSEIVDMILKSAFNKFVIPKKYDVNFTYSMRDLSQNEAEKFNKVSDYFETAIMNLLSDMMDYCSEIEMEVKRK